MGCASGIIGDDVEGVANNLTEELGIPVAACFCGRVPDTYRWEQKRHGEGILTMKINAVLMGRVDYGDALEIQKELLRKRQQGEIDDTLLLLEHPPVITLGTRGDYRNILVPRKQLEAAGVEIFETNRGGDVTYHGPGQIVGYPVVDLKEHGRDIRQFVWNIEELFIRLLQREFNIQAHREEKKYTGVWVDDEKITAIGIAVKHWVTMHGFAFNVNTDLAHFKWINPCGITDKGVTSVQKLTGSTQELEKVTRLVPAYFSEVFETEYEIKDISQIL